jgi:PAS domain-containing protein
MEYRRKTKSGQWLWLHSIGQVVEWDKYGVSIRVVGVHVDITKRKQAEIKLIESEKRLRLSQAAGGIGSWEYGYVSNTSICSSNVALQLKFPWAAEDPTWDDVFAAIYPEDHDAVNQCIEKHITEGTKLDVEYRITDTEGNKISGRKNATFCAGF